ncbi:ribose-5-phosphate isomerase RpiA [Blochmannia endosymbiont of Camponotus (Colobopsis) obliquus]|uniref:ribose-5-phosphate isomerase RpiA n=1 Tax=Blochmannia endosymbiont of Camponotus (Colobopsis) obliquus TaxID=1505597 RepID=UPI00061A5BC8|nr:ribose-5-phosphate isomerase RpiA [Blochmannia endosymbiont of Camponotus (Colobopsis) obliquus]AKC60420.1 ribose 5-phosphate isomerase A [Blochmannia endosymbiont of Camponotus (Colobopsis) obliquus]
MKKNVFKEAVGWAALNYIQPESIVGVGSGSTVSYFIKALSTAKTFIKGAVSSSDISSVKLKKLGITLFDLNDIDTLDVYVDSADEINKNMQMIKGGGGALTREKIIAAAACRFICIIDISKRVDILGNFPLPVEVIPMGRSFVSRELRRLGGYPKYRCGVITDNGNNILDVYNLKIFDAVMLEEKINNIPGVVTVGVFARRVADVVLIGSDKGVEIID